MKIERGRWELVVERRKYNKMKGKEKKRNERKMG